MSEHQPTETAENRVTSPFADAASPIRRKNGNSRVGLWVFSGAVGVAFVIAGSVFFFQHLNDPLRTLEVFPVGKYMDSYKPLAGSRFRASLRVENDLGWKDSVGRLMVFSLPQNSRPIVVLIPPETATLYFTKGQTFEAELEVKEGGLIYANSLRKD